MVHMKWHWQRVIPPLQSLWHNMIRKPYHWIFLCFFQPSRFRAAFEHMGFFQRLSIMFQLAIPLLLFSLIFALPTQLLLSSCNQSCIPWQTSPLSLSILTSIYLGTLSGVICGLIVGILGDVGLGIMLALALGITGL